MTVLYCKAPRLVVAGLKGDSGKSLVSLGLVRALRDRGKSVAPFKKGPDFIDAAWLEAAAASPCRNLDTFMMSPDVIKGSFARGSLAADIAVVEGNRGLFDGMDSAGSHSTAELAKIIGSPVILVVEVTKTTRTVAALVKGCQAMDPDLTIAGVILNRVGTKRQEAVIREAIALETGLPVLGALPRLEFQHLPSRHLGLVTAMEHPDVERALSAVETAVSKHVDLDQILALCASHLKEIKVSVEATDPVPLRRTVRVGVLRDKAFSFYYPENLEALEGLGAELIYISPLEDAEFPEVDGLYAGGGFPEVHAERLSLNRSFKEALLTRVDEGLPVWAECGGLMYLSRSICVDGSAYPMVGALPIDVEHTKKPKGHGYVRAVVEQSNPFMKENTAISGHEFHYSRLLTDPEKLATVMRLEKGRGIGNRRDGIRYRSAIASYTHIHALGTPSWADGVINAVRGGTR